MLGAILFFGVPHVAPRAVACFVHCAAALAGCQLWPALCADGRCPVGGDLCRRGAALGVPAAFGAGAVDPFSRDRLGGVGGGGGCVFLAGRQWLAFGVVGGVVRYTGVGAV
ncbi:hypothetical protein D9M71_428510 [compost metagenome]